jgi:replicative superfamily II helicase
MGGRAGRLSLEHDFGRSVLVATTPLEQMQFEHCYFEAELEELLPQLTGVDLETHAMNLVAARAAHSRQDIGTFLSHTLTGMRHSKALSEHQQEFKVKIDSAVEHCIEYGLLSEAGGQLAASELGRLCAVKGIAARSGHDITTWLRSAKCSPRPQTEIEAIYAVVRTPEARAQQVNMSTDEYRAWVYSDRLLQIMPRAALEHFSPVLGDRIYQTYEEVKVMKVALILKEWVEGCKALDIEEEFLSLAGTIRAAGEMSGWLMDAAASIADLLGFPKVDGEFLRDLSVRLEAGVRSEGVPFCRIRIRGFGRTHVQKLLNAGFTDLDTLRKATDDALASAIGKSMGRRVRAWLAGCGTEAPAKTSAEANAPEPEPAAVITAPPAQEFACQDRLHFEAIIRKRRTVIAVNGVREEIPNKTFAMLLKMAIRLRDDGIGWVRKDEFGESSQQAISNARKDIQRLLPDPEAEILENDGYGSYRLSVPPENVTFDWPRIREHWDGQISSLAKSAVKSAASSC